jgi:hypothetical protein
MPRTPWTWTWLAPRGARPLSPPSPVAITPPAVPPRSASPVSPHPSRPLSPLLGLVQHDHSVCHNEGGIGGGGGPRSRTPPPSPVTLSTESLDTGAELPKPPAASVTSHPNRRLHSTVEPTSSSPSELSTFPMPPPFIIGQRAATAQSFHVSKH